MAQYYWDLAFNWNAAEESNTQSALQCGLVLEGNPNFRAGMPGSSVSLDIGDTIGFSVFNVTSGAGLAGYSLLSGLMTFTNGNAQAGDDFPFNSAAPVPLGNETTVMPVVGQSSVTVSTPSFGPASYFALSAYFSFPEFSSTFPSWQLVSPQWAVSNNGNFYFSAALTIQGPNGDQRTFYTDPEMIVGGTN